MRDHLVKQRSQAKAQSMIPDLDIYRVAKLLIDQHGEDAPIRAAKRVEELVAHGDAEGPRSGGPSWMRSRSFSAGGWTART